MPIGSEAPLPRRRDPSTGARVTEQLLSEMQAAQWWSPSRIRRYQLREIEKLLNYARQYSPYYQSLLPGPQGGELSAAALFDLPLLSRETLRDQRDRIRCSRVPSQHGALDEMMTSGSTGSPVVVDTTAYVAAVWAAVTLRDHLWHRRDARLSNASIRWRVENVGMAPEGLEFPDWGAPFNQFYETGPGWFLNSSSPVSEQLQWLVRRNPHYLISHPSNLRALIAAIAANGVKLPNLRQVRTVGESLDAELRDRARAVLDVPLIDFYSSQEVGYIALQCPEHDHYHVQAENLFVEILDARNQPCQPGQTGRVVVTSLRNYATPLLRYDIGDYAEAGAVCSCGRGLPVLNKILGRVRNMLTLPDGSKRWPNIGFREIMKIAPLRQFQLVQHSLQRLELRLVVDTALSVEQEQKIRQTLASYLQFPNSIELSYHREIARNKGGKFEDFVSHVN